jgi:hypothetical protein
VENKVLLCTQARPHQADYLGSMNLETITQGIRGELKRIIVDKYNVGTALLQIKECHLCRQRKRCHSFNSFISIFADEDPLEHFSKLPYLTLALKIAPKGLAETMKKLKSETVRGFLRYARTLSPTKSLPKKKPSQYAPVVIRSTDLTPDAKAVHDIVLRGTIAVVLGIRNLASKKHLEVLLEKER